MILAAVDDLMFSSRITTAAKAVGREVRFARSPQAVLAAAGQAAPALVILDLNSPRVRPLEIVAALRADPTLAAVPTVGVVSHMDGAAIDAARRAGVGRVLARSAFVDRLPALLAEAGPARP